MNVGQSGGLPDSVHDLHAIVGRQIQINEEHAGLGFAHSGSVLLDEQEGLLTGVLEPPGRIPLVVDLEHGGGELYRLSCPR